MQSRRYARREGGAAALRLAVPRPGGTSRPRKRRLRRAAAGFLVLTLVLLLGADLLLRPSIAETLRYQGKIAAVRILSEETLAILEPMRLEYEELSHVSRDESGRVTSIETDMTRLNTIKSRLESQVTAALKERGAEEMKLPLGSLLGSEYLAGRGPEVGVRIVPVGALRTEFESVFQSAGINQTSHRIVLNLTLELSTVIPLHSAQTTVQTNFILADTVIVGDVPDYYTNITGNAEALSSVPDPLDVSLRSGEAD